MLRLDRFGVLVCGATLFLPACGDDEQEACTLGTTEGCDDGQVCEAFAGSEEPRCAAPVVIEGRVFDSADDSGIEGARIVALDINGGARSVVAISGADGGYSLPILVERDADGNPVSESITLRVSADGYQAFPTSPRTALPIDLGTATEGDGRLSVQTTATDVALIELSGDTANLGSIAGRIDLPDAGGVLVVAEQGGEAVSTAITDGDGNFVLFNVPSGETSVDGFRAGVNVSVQDVTVGDNEDVTDVVLSASAEGLATVSGSVNIVNAPGGLTTSVILVVESTFDDTFVRGEAPAGLRAGDVSGAFEITDVPPGRYVVLAAFENDELVRDPDEGIAGTAIVHIEVPEDGGTVTIEESFKITEALAVVSPGGMGIEVVSDTEPTFVWADDSSEDGYEFRLFNAFGELVSGPTDVPGVSGSETVSHTLTGVSLIPGMVYQFRVVSFRERTGGRTFISATEDLRGVFTFQPAPAL